MDLRNVLSAKDADIGGPDRSTDKVECEKELEKAVLGGGRSGL